MTKNLFDMNRLARNRRRAASLDPAAMFLHDLAADQLSERLSEVNRRFTNPAIVSGFNDFWAERFPKAAMVAESEVLDIRTAAHDLVVHAMSLHWANDPVGQMIQCRRALRPDGLFLGVLLGGRTLHELRSTLTEAEIETRGGLGGLLRNRKARYWEVYEKIFADISDQAENDFQELFSREFARAYKEQLEKLKQ